MSQLFHIHPENPQLRLINEAVKIIQQGGVVVYPTDSCYALGCHLGDKKAMDRIIAIRQLDLRHLAAAPDHPIALAVPEGEYLKGLLCQV